MERGDAPAERRICTAIEWAREAERGSGVALSESHGWEISLEPPNERVRETRRWIVDGERWGVRSERKWRGVSESVFLARMARAEALEGRESRRRLVMASLPDWIASMSGVLFLASTVETGAPRERRKEMVESLPA
ncbi:hypothetical protein ONS96_000671 [Cadophora gregata f. sp. sojae]|nr:hypothetical protein ONS96_000671 [Cadophora gregata f. sp. sojae]